MALRTHNGVLVADPLMGLSASLDALDVQISTALPGWQWLARTDEAMGGFANITSPDFGAVMVETPLGFTQQTRGKSYPVYASSPAAALAVALEMATAAQRGLN